jgi:hypothetical protein
MDDEVPILDEENYSTWRIEMRVYLKTMGAAIWKATIGGYVPLKNKSKLAAQREGKKNDALALKTILSGLSSPMLSLKFRPHVATRTPHRQHRKAVIHGTRLIPQHSKRVKTIQNGQKIARRFTPTRRARACA